MNIHFPGRVTQLKGTRAIWHVLLSRSQPSEHVNHDFAFFLMKYFRAYNQPFVLQAVQLKLLRNGTLKKAAINSSYVLHVPGGSVLKQNQIDRKKKKKSLHYDWLLMWPMTFGAWSAFPRRGFLAAFWYLIRIVKIRWIELGRWWIGWLHRTFTLQ